MNKIYQNINSSLNSLCGTKFILRSSKKKQLEYLDYDKNYFLNNSRNNFLGKKKVFLCQNKKPPFKLNFVLNEKKYENLKIQNKKTQKTFFLKKIKKFYIRPIKEGRLKKPINNKLYFIRNFFIKRKLASNKLLFLNLAYNTNIYKKHFISKIKLSKSKSYLFRKYFKKLRKRKIKRINIIKLKSKKLYAINKYIKFQKKLEKLRVQKLRLKKERLFKNKVQQQRKQWKKIRQEKPSFIVDSKNKPKVSSVLSNIKKSKRNNKKV